MVEQTDKRKKKKKLSETAGIEEELELGPGVRVMIRRNLDVDRGLVNGTIATVTEVVPFTDRAEVVKLVWNGPDGVQQETEIRKCRVDYELTKSIMVTREQFPMSAGYSFSVHKVCSWGL